MQDPNSVCVCVCVCYECASKRCLFSKLKLEVIKRCLHALAACGRSLRLLKRILLLFVVELLCVGGKWKWKFDANDRSYRYVYECVSVCHEFLLLLY